MASNEVPKQVDRITTFAEDAADGLHALEVAIGIKQNLEADVRADLSDVAQSELNYQAARSLKKAKTEDQGVADADGRQFILKAKGLFENSLGRTWSVDWGQVGFVNGSLSVPTSMEERQALLLAMKNYMIADGSRENTPLGVTAAAAEAARAALSDARSAANAATTAATTKKNIRDTAVKALRKRLQGLVDELRQLLDDDDERWYTFGLNRPSDPETPAVPESLVLTPGLPGNVNGDWLDALRAERYHVFRMIVGVDTDFVRIATVTDSDVTFNSMTSGVTVKVRVTSVNDAGESLPSEEAQIVVP